jgi:S-adenosylmethionine:tRNA ribosyltransferase-isomerase
MANVWEVLFPAKQIKNDETILLPDGVTAKLIERGLPQKIQTSISLTEDYFLKFGELALPPYIQKARGERHNRKNEEELYQTAWAKNFGSHASPTASLHFTKEDLLALKDRGVIIAPLTLHVGIGTFLPIKTVQLSEHKMHGEFATISQSSIEAILRAKEQKHKVWALGTTAVRTLESWAAGKLQAQENGDVAGVTNLFIQPGYKFQVVDNLLTNFHQPGSTLLALVAAFAEHSLNGANGLEVVHAAYQFAIENKFRLFSYGDLSIWMT